MDKQEKTRLALADLKQDVKTKSVAVEKINAGYANFVKKIIVQKNMGNFNSLYKIPFTILPAGFYLTLDNLSSDLIIENRPYRVYFTLWNHTGAATTGIIKASVQPLKSLSPYEGNFDFEVTDLQPGQSIGGVITFNAPESVPVTDGRNTITVTYYVPEQRPADLPDNVEWFGVNIDVAHDSLDFDVAGRYTLTVDRITIFDTASYHNDTVLVAINSAEGGQPTGTIGYLGDHDNGTFPVGIAELGPYDSVPDLSQDVSLAWLIANYGYSSEQETLDKVLDIMSDIGAAVATIILGGVYAPLSAAADALNHLINDTLLADCDTVVALDAKIFSSRDLYDLTYDPTGVLSTSSAWVRAKKKAGDQLTSWLGKGCRDSDYNIEWRITRYRQPVEVASIFSEDGIKIGYGETIHIGYITREAVTWEWQLQGDGHCDDFGNYIAPAQPGIYNYAVMIGTGLVDGVPKYSGFTVIFFG